MGTETIDVQEACGCVLAIDSSEHDEAERRWWFDQTEAGRLVFCAEIVHYTEDYSVMTTSSGRHYVDEVEMDVPSPVRDALAESGFDEQIVDTSGRTL